LEAVRLDFRFDLVVCNMIRSEAQPLVRELPSRMTDRGILILSGQRREDRRYWEQWLAGTGAKVIREMEMDGWWGFAASVPAK
jgi:ribosomal protein L11 methylase PrmA